MKLRALLMLIGPVLVGAIAFYVGFQDGKSKMDSYCGLIIQSTSASDHASALSLHSSALKALSNGDTKEAERLLDILTRADGHAIDTCRNDSQCRTMLSR